MINRYLFTILFSVLLLAVLQAQQPIATFNMDCSLAEENGNYQDIFTANFPSCECGVELEAFDVSGLPNLSADTSISQIFQSDFAISFYFQTLNASSSNELISVGNNCQSDSLLRVYYVSTSEEVVFEISESFQETARLSAVIPTNKCWTHVIVSRQNNAFYLYINGELADDVNFNSEIKLNPTLPVDIGHGSCVGSLSNTFSGLIDKLEFFDQHIQAFRAEELYIRNDEIISSDTTIFIGDVIELEAIQTCNSNISWIPATGISATTSFVTMLEGIESNAYVARFEGDFCVSTDTVQVFVIDPSDVLCEEIILPNVFTPNGDGLNDQFGILNRFIVEDLNYFEIYDRWGQKVFATSDKNESWDGSFKGKATNSAMLVYKVSYQCNGVEYVKMGNVSILR